MAGRRVVVALGIVIAAAIVVPRRHPRAPTRAPIVPVRAVEAPVTVARARLPDIAPRITLPPLHRALHTSGPARITGIAREHGSPVTGATIWTVQLPQPGRSADEVAGANEGPITDAWGRFSLDDLPPGELAIWAVHDGRSSTLLQPLSLSAGEEIDGVELELTGSSIAEGIVIDERGDQADAEVAVSVEDIELVRADTSSEGRFRFDSLPDEPISIVASALGDEGDDTERGAELTLDHASTSIVLRLHAMPPQLVVEVVDEAGAADYGAFVSVHSPNSTSSAMSGGSNVTSFSHLGGKVSITATDESRELASDPIDVELIAGEHRSVRVVLRPTTCASGRVLDANGAPATGMVELSTPSSTQTQLVVLEDGAYRFCIGRAGTYALHWSPMSQRQGPDAIYGDVPLDVDLAPGRTRLRDVYLPAPRSVQVLLIDEEGAPARGHVQIESNSGASSVGFVPTDERGSVVVNLIGPVQLRAVAPTGASEPARAPDGGGVTLALASFGDVEVLLRGAPPGTSVRCGTQPWEPLASTALVDLLCHTGDTLEAMVGGEQRRFTIPVDLDETSYAELRWD